MFLPLTNEGKVMRHQDTSRLPLSKLADLEEDVGSSNLSPNASFDKIVEERFARRSLLKTALVASTAAGVGAGNFFGDEQNAEAATNAGPSFAFEEISHGVDETHHVAAGYDANVLLRWGDPITADAPEFDPAKQSANAQLKQFGYNNDFVGFVPLPLGSVNSDHGLLCVNHEYTDEEVMFPGLGQQDTKEVDFNGMTKELVDIEMAAHGCSVVEIKRGADGKWAYVRDSKYNRRLTPLNTQMEITGPAKGHALMITAEDKTGANVIGTINNCAGGITPWGTYVTAEENFNGYFMGAKSDIPSLKRYGVPAKWYVWGKYHPRFDADKSPNEANRFGWIVEIDPYDPTSAPKKRTAMGRFKHEGAGFIVDKSGHVASYMGDDERFEYVYKFITKNKMSGNRKDNLSLLEEGTLYVAKFNADGTGEWLPLIHGQGPLTLSNGFADQAQVMINARQASDLLGATKMDRPEDVEPNPKTGKIYIMLTNNNRRKAEQIDKANPRAENLWGQVAEITPHQGDDHLSTKFTWSLLLRAGNPAVAEIGAAYHPETSANGWFSCPDNCAIDSLGRLWISTDQGENWKKASGTADGLWAVETEGKLRGKSTMFWRNPVGAELCGPFFTPDDTSLFLAVQHPAVDGAEEWEKFGKKSTFEEPATRWPDFKPNMPPRPSVVVITKQGGGKIGV
jgi:uncharacterized protein